ncbi:MAG: DedA family protein [Phycisphaeraceae bacterium]|nr:DedA family protein [Phycisphaeraceae bacterium]
MLDLLHQLPQFLAFAEAAASEPSAPTGILDFFLHLDASLEWVINQWGPWIYAILFAVIFCETGLVITPFLPGDSLLFTVGALSASGHLHLWLIAGLLLAAAILGDAVNYSIGKFIGPRVFTMEQPKGFKGKVFNRKYLDKAHSFFEKYGGKAIVLARWVPIVRTFVPFVAGAGSMRYPAFAFYNVTGAIIWIGVCIGAGYAFGNIPWVKNNFEIMVLGIIFVSLIPIGLEVLGARREARRAKLKVIEAITPDAPGEPENPLPADPLMQATAAKESE